MKKQTFPTVNDQHRQPIHQIALDVKRSNKPTHLSEGLEPVDSDTFPGGDWG
jgi:hypothetical protein